MSSDNSEALKVLPVCGAESPDAAWLQLSIGGLVKPGPGCWTFMHCRDCRRARWLETSAALAGGSFPDQQWEGVPVADLLDGCGPAAGSAVCRLHVRRVYRGYDAGRGKGCRSHRRPATQTAPR